MIICITLVQTERGVLLFTGWSTTERLSEWKRAADAVGCTTGSLSLTLTDLVAGVRHYTLSQ